MHNTVVYIYLHLFKINILICDSKICWISKETLMHNVDAIIIHCICHSIVKLLYLWEGKREICSILEGLGTKELRCTSLCTTTMYIELYGCMYFIAKNYQRTAKIANITKFSYYHLPEFEALLQLTNKTFMTIDNIFM